MRNKYTVFSFVFFTLLILGVSLIIYRQYRLTHFSCTSSIVVADDRYRSSAQINLQVEGIKGYLAADGVITDRQGLALPFRTIVALSVSRHKNHYTLTNRNSTNLYGHQHTAEVNDISPPFLEEKNAIISFTLFKQGKSGFIITHGASFAYCKNDNN